MMYAARHYYVPDDILSPVAPTPTPIPPTPPEIQDPVPPVPSSEEVAGGDPGGIEMLVESSEEDIFDGMKMSLHPL